MFRKGMLCRAALAAILILGLGSTLASAEDGSRSREPAELGNAPASTWGGTLDVDAKERHGTDADGDLWPSCWADDGDIYSAWGDGRGFDLEGDFFDIGAAKISGPADDLEGVNTAVGDEVGTLWNTHGYSRKPTGMVCVGNTLHLAVQDLSHTFDDAPAATIVTSEDGGKTWNYDKSEPMFSDHVFTTIWFADHGPGGEWAPDNYVYTYGLDGNWRDSYRDSVDDPTDLFLARVPRDRVDDRSAWQFYSGMTRNGSRPTWSKKIDQRAPVLHDDRRVYEEMFDTDLRSNISVLSQGHVLYNQPLDRYIYSSWSEYAHHFYESPTPWGPWKRMSDRDYTSLNQQDQYGGYGTVLPSKFLSEDGTKMMLQANICCGLPNASQAYHYSLRELEIVPKQEGAADNEADGTNLAAVEGTVPIAKSVRQGSLAALSDGETDTSLDDRDGEAKDKGWWGYTWPQDQHFNRVQYTTGQIAEDGGWFVTRPKVQVRQDGEWVEVSGQVTTPEFGGREDGSTQTYTVTFPTVAADGVRVIGPAGGDQRYTSMSEIAVEHRVQVVDGGFENSVDYGPAWDFDGESGHGFDRDGDLSHEGKGNAWVRTPEALGPQYVTQQVSVQPGSTVDLSAWFRTSEVVKKGFIGARWDGGEQVESFATDTPDEYVQQSAKIDVPEGVETITLMLGYSADGGDAILQLDDVEITTD